VALAVILLGDRERCSDFPKHHPRKAAFRFSQVMRKQKAKQVFRWRANANLLSECGFAHKG
jgi:hypothetical protein